MTKTIAVTGATGTQGGSVARILLATGAWKVRAITRNPNGNAAQTLATKGAEVVGADFDDEDSLVKAFEGVEAIFAVTNFWEHLLAGKSPSEAGEIEAKHAVNLAKAASQTETLQHYVWSTLPSANDGTNGQCHVPHFDYKARVDQRIRDEYPELAAKTTYLYVGFYSSNLAFLPGLKPIEVPGSGKYIWPITSKPSTTFPITGDVSVTVGTWVRQILAHPKKALGKYAIVHAEVVSFEKIAQDWSEVTGKPVVVVEFTSKEYEDLWGVLGVEINMQFKFCEVVSDWPSYLGSSYVSKEELDIKPEEARGLKYALEQIKTYLL
ncbi:uncharacterized protein K452DRAFT_285154 [Aplosporella prunicola CBS 121167]|uniref:NmrA-like domain-containing protein n=1 Tax=Aplosporella prunicola CBS 121167 TaxID=1176127 RepID=A0A6A6BL31_9PEZI|nr:uncharacterized protein K452DRAFT_285154 [Aplosporella prunicola CBS 121167]KAF2144830.1 hypothetical protein K452DRAFT_285154 [Aplosporella prunicola CBS 121167]